MCIKKGATYSSFNSIYDCIHEQELRDKFPLHHILFKEEGAYFMNTTSDARNLEVTLIKLMENHSINEDDYNLIHKYLIKINNDLKIKA